ncbi:MAG: Rieske 2Fe-2S domain-containing protein [Gammaproteobacteria bacterium]|nr:Rieske 2Fe-2S domain-containing protein [Gammaproteobacteria bacterium]
MSDSVEWVAVIAAKDLERGWVTSVALNGREYAIYDTPSGLYASLGYCTHEGAALRDGYFDRYTIECPPHQGCFDVRTGAATGAPATRALRTLPVREHEGMIELDLPATARG